MAERVRVSVEEAKEKMEEQDITFLDVIDTPSYDDYDLKIKGAIRIKPENIADQYKQLSKDKAVYAY